jgi:hypothetical protein
MPSLTSSQESWCSHRSGSVVLVHTVDGMEPRNLCTLPPALFYLFRALHWHFMGESRHVSGEHGVTTHQICRAESVAQCLQCVMHGVVHHT